MSPLSCVVLLILGASAGSTSDVETKRVAAALERVLEYVLANKDLMNVDALFGIIFTQAHLDGVLKENTSTKYIDTVKFLRSKTNEIIESTKSNIIARSTYKKFFIKSVLSTERWKRDIDFKSGLININYEPFANADFKSFRDFWHYQLKVTFMESQSDSCLGEVLKSGSRNAQHTCTISQSCKHVMIEDNISPAYGVTHRLLYLQLARSQNCVIPSVSYEDRMRNYCTYIYWEMKMNRKFGFRPELDDLLLEQVTLCGFEGFAEFFDTDIVDHIISIQRANGCYSVNKVNRSHKVKRMANTLGDGCIDHTTGLGASTLSIVLRYLLQT